MSAFSKVHPLVSAVYFIAVMSIGMFSTNPVVELVSLAGSALFCAVITQAGEKKRDVPFYLVLALLIAATNPLFSHNGETELFFINNNPVTLESFAYGCCMAVTVVSVMLWFKAFGSIMTSDKLVYLFGRFAPQISLIFSMSLRYVPLLKRQVQKISRAQKAMGLYSSDKISDRLRSAISVISALIGWSLENAVETGKAMKARGYGLKGHTNYSDFSFSKSDLLLMLVCLALWAVTLAGMAAGKLDFYFYPVITEIPSGTSSVICYAAYGGLSLLPFIFETEEMIRWKYYKSKI